MENQLDQEERKEKCSRQLDFNAPFLSTRRPSEKSLSSSNIPPRLSLDIFNRVPFSWEQSPGKPKEMVTDIEIVPTPKLPPCMWHARKEAMSTNVHDEGFDGDIDNDDDNENDVRDDNRDVFSDALDVFSLGESIDMIETEHRESNTSANMEVVEESYDWNTRPTVPNFIIQRFLQDAKELAISSVLENSKKDEQNGTSTSSFCRAVSVGRKSCSISPKAASCGLDMFFPWKIKPKPCCVKNSVVAASPRMRSQWTNRDNHASDVDPKF